MRRLSIPLAAAALSLALAACGSDESSSTIAGEPSVAATAPGGAGSAKQGSNQPQAAVGGERSDDGSSASPAPRADSGGGSRQFRVKGADNSIPGYGVEAADSERAEAAEVLHRYLDAHVAGDYGEMCSLLSAQILKNLDRLARQVSRRNGSRPGLGGCPQTLAALSAKVPQSSLEANAAIDVGSLRRDGDEAFLLYRRGDTEMSIYVVVEGGAWKLGAIEGNELH